MKEFKKYLMERNILPISPVIDIQDILEKAGIESNIDREFIEFEYRGKRYEISQVDR